MFNTHETRFPKDKEKGKGPENIYMKKELLKMSQRGNKQTLRGDVKMLL